MTRSKWMNVALLLSISANILILGFVLGRGLPFTDHSDLRRGASDRLDPTAGYFRVLHNWPENRRESFRPVLRKHMKGMRSHFKEIPPLHREIQESLSHEPFDAEALATALQKLRAHLLVSQEKTHTSLIELAKTMPLEERQRLAREIREPRRGFPGRRPSGREAESVVPRWKPVRGPGPEHGQAPG